MTTLDAADDLKFGIFLAPFHPVGQNPTLALERDLQLIEHLDPLGFDEAWFGEHHSAGYEIIASPEVFIAAAAQRTRHIRLGTGVSSLPYHHPFMLADRLVLLDHLTRGRLMIGVGPGALPSDAFMMGIDPAKQRDMMEEGLEAILLLLEGNEPVTMETEWFKLVERPAADAALPAPLPRGGGGGPGVAGRAAGGGPVRLRPALHRRHLGRRRLRHPRRPLGRHGGAGRRVRHHGRPRQVAPGRADAHRRHQGAGHRRRGLRPRGVGRLLPAGGRPARSRPTPPTSRRWSTPSSPRASPSSARSTTPSPRSSACAPSPAGSAPSSSWATSGPTPRPPATPTSSSPATWRPQFQDSSRTLTASRDWAAENRPEFIGAAGNAVMSAIVKHQEEKATKTANA